MRRRALLATLSGAIAATAGCLGGTEPGTDGSPPATGSPTLGPTSSLTPPRSSTPTQPPTATSTPRSDADLDYSLTMHSPTYESDSDGTAVAFKDGGTSVVVAGTMRYGSSSCDEIAVTDLRWATDDAVQVAVEAQTKPTDTGTCTADVATADYELTISTSGVPVRKLLVVEIPYDGDARERTATPTG